MTILTIFKIVLNQSGLSRFWDIYVPFSSRLIPHRSISDVSEYNKHTPGKNNIFELSPFPVTQWFSLEVHAILGNVLSDVNLGLVPTGYGLFSTTSYQLPDWQQ